ncbi:hypothetical protein V8E36_007041 [Tilletia maclaganii]
MYSAEFRVLMICFIAQHLGKEHLHACLSVSRRPCRTANQSKADVDNSNIALLPSASGRFVRRLGEMQGWTPSLQHLFAATATLRTASSIDQPFDELPWQRRSWTTWVAGREGRYALAEQKTVSNLRPASSRICHGQQRVGHAWISWAHRCPQVKRDVDSPSWIMHFADPPSPSSAYQDDAQVAAGSTRLSRTWTRGRGPCKIIARRRDSFLDKIASVTSRTDSPPSLIPMNSQSHR